MRLYTRQAGKKVDRERAGQAPRSTGHVFLSGVAILTLSTVLVKVIGLFYKIPMLHYLGSEGMGYFNAAYEWYATLCVLTTAGLPLAGSMLIAEARAAGHDAAIRRTETLLLGLFIGLGTVGSLILAAGAPLIARAIGSPDTRYAIAAVAPTLFFSCMSGAYRGYFQGYQNMAPTAISQLIEAVGKLVLGLGFAMFAWRRGMSAPYVAAWAMLGLGIGVGISVIYLILYRRSYRPQMLDMVIPANHAPQGTLRRLIGIAIPVTLSSSILSLTRLLDTTMILRRLQTIGYDTAAANAMYGSYTTMAVPIFNLIPSLVTSVALALVPALRAAIEAGNAQAQRTTANMAIRMTVLLSLPASLAVALYSRTILSLLFHGEPAAAASAAPLLSILSVSIFFSGLITTTNAILQAYGHVKAPIFSMLAGAVLKLIAAYGLIGIPSLNIYGAPISTFLCDGLIVGINLALIAKTTDAVEGIGKSLIRPLAVSLPSVGIPALFYVLLSAAGYSEIPLFLAAVPVTVLLFFALCLQTGLITTGDIFSMLGDRSGKLLRVWHRIRRKKPSLQ